MKTKELILIRALELFSSRGFDSVSVRDIAHEVGVRESALYKHYKNKQAIFEAIVEQASLRAREIYTYLNIPNDTSDHVTEAYREIGIEQLQEISAKLFHFYICDEIMAPYRRMLTIEQYKSDAYRCLYQEHFINGFLEKCKKLFKTFIDNGLFKEEDPEILALHFYGPIYLLFQKYDRQPERVEEGERLIKEHIKLFATNYDKRIKRK